MQEEMSETPLQFVFFIVLTDKNRMSIHFYAKFFA